MIWLASFPRSGNTFFRNVLHEVYGISSSTFHLDAQRPLDQHYEQFPVVKTHLLPGHLKPNSQDIKSVYILRDGRDALVSIAHHRKDIVQPGSDFYNNLLEAILALGGSHFGGWSENVRQWTERADVVIRFEDLIQNPIQEIEKLRGLLDLPTPQLDKLPTFESLKFGRPAYGGGKGKDFDSQRLQKHFRRGKVGAWKEEMPPELEHLFWCQHGATMEKWGYERSAVSPQSSFFFQKKSPKKILIEASKLFTQDNDGIQRYLLELVEHLPALLEHQADWQIDLYHNNRVQPLHSLQTELQERGLKKFHRPSPVEEVNTQLEQLGGHHDYENRLLQLKATIKERLPSGLYRALSYSYRKGPFRAMLRQYQRHVTQQKYTTAEKAYQQLLNSYDLIHVPLPQHMKFVQHLDARFLVTVHDLTPQLFPDFHTEDNIEGAEAGMQQLLKKEAHVLAISKATKSDMQRLYKLPEDRLHLVYEAANRGRFHRAQRQADFAPIRARYQLPDVPFLLCLSTIEPRKNLVNTIQAFLSLIEEQPQLDIHLFICGKKGWKFEQLFSEAMLQSERIHFTGFVDDDHLPLFYAQALALCYVSHYEGFGLPILEAMSCGTPVIYGDNSSMPEVVGEGGLAATADDVASIKRQLLQLISKEELRAEKSQKAWAQAQRFSWLKVVLETLEVYRKIIHS
ncbi:MAG: glycosyltransferase [Bacteroidota bacterium]